MTSIAMHSLMTWHDSPGQFVPGTPSLPRIPARLHADSPAAVVPVVSTNLSGYHTVASPHWRGNQSVPVTPRVAQLRTYHGESSSSSSHTRAFLVAQSPALPPQAAAISVSKQEEQVVPCMTPESLPIVSPAKPRSALYHGVMSPTPPNDETFNSSCNRATLQRTRQKASGIQVPKRSIHAHQRSIQLKKRLSQTPQPTPNQQSPLMDLFSGENIFA